jgi:hypothetical protein
MDWSSAIEGLSDWHWLLAVLLLAAAAQMLIRLMRRDRAIKADPNVSGIGGWLALLGFALSVGLIRNAIAFLYEISDFMRGFRNPDADVPLALLGFATSLQLVTNAWVVIALFRKSRHFTIAYFAFWQMSAIVPLSALTVLTVPGVTLDMVLPLEDLTRSIASFVILGLWFWYLRASARVRNTFQN